MTTARRLVGPALVVAAGAALAACGIPLSNAAQPLSRTGVSSPPGLLDRRPTTTTVAPRTPNPVPIHVYFLNASGTRLVTTTAEEPPPATASEALGLLAYGPTAADNNAGYQTALSTTPQATPSVKVDKTGLATVALDFSTESLYGTGQFEALAQIVFTVTDPRFRVRGVRFTFEGDPVEAYLPNGSYTPRPVTRADYAALAPLTRRTPPTTTTPTSAVTATVTRPGGRRPG